MRKVPPVVDFHGSFAVRFWSATYSPEQALSPVENWDGAYGPTGCDYEVAQTPDVRSGWRSPSLPLTALGGWLDDHGLEIKSRTLVRQKRIPQWCGFYVLAIGPKVAQPVQTVAQEW